MHITCKESITTSWCWRWLCRYDRAARSGASESSTWVVGGMACSEWRLEQWRYIQLDQLGCKTQTPQQQSPHQPLGQRWWSQLGRQHHSGVTSYHNSLVASLQPITAFYVHWSWISLHWECRVVSTTFKTATRVLCRATNSSQWAWPPCSEHLPIERNRTWRGW